MVLAWAIHSAPANAAAYYLSNSSDTVTNLFYADSTVLNIAYQYGYPPPPICVCGQTSNYLYYQEHYQEIIAAEINGYNTEISQALTYIREKADVTILYNSSNKIEYIIVKDKNYNENSTITSLENQLKSTRTTDPALFNLTLTILNLPTGQAQQAASQLQPVANGAASQASAAASSQALGTIQDHNQSVRLSEGGQTGAAAGDEPLGLTVWGQGFGAVNHQGNRGDSDGYSSRSWGYAAGADTAVIGNLRLGLSLAQAYSHVDDRGSREGSGLRIHSTIASLYGNYAGRGWYADSSLSYGWHSTDSTRLIAIPSATTEAATASFTAHQTEVKTEFGLPLAVGPGTITPLASLDYSHFHQPGYSESGAVTALTLSGQDTDSFRSGLGAAVSHPLNTEDGWEIKPTIKAVWLHEFDGKAQTQTSAFTAGGSSFTTSGAKPGLNHLDLGLGLDLDNRQGSRISLKYDGDWGPSYWGNSGSLQVSVDF